MNRKRIFQTWLSILMLVVVNYGSVTAEVSPVASALHVLPPLGKAYDDLSNFDATLLDYLTVSICRLEAATCTPVQEFTSTDGKKLEQIILEEEEGEPEYHVNWYTSKGDLGHNFQIRFLVAGLQVDAIECTPRGQRTVPIKFRIDNHPLIRAHVLCETGLSAVEAADVLIEEFSLTVEDLPSVLIASCYDCVDVSEVLKDTFELNAVETVSTLIDAGCDCEAIGEALASTFGTTDDETASILLAAGCDCDAVGSVLKNTFSLSDVDADPILVGAGCDTELKLLAEKFAPQLRFDGGAFNFPMSAQEYYDEVILTGRSAFPEYPHMENTDSSTLNVSVPTYYRATRCENNQVRIFYWWFYGWQAECFLRWGSHNGDWEQVMVTLSEDETKVAAVTFWQHAGWYTRPAGDSDWQACPSPFPFPWPWEECGFELYEETHPAVYVGRIAHGSYHNEGGLFGSCLYQDDLRRYTNPALRLDTWEKLRHIDAGTETWRESNIQWGYEGVWTKDRKHIMTPPGCDDETVDSCNGPYYDWPFGSANGCWLSQCRCGDRIRYYYGLEAYCIHCPWGYTVIDTDSGVFCAPNGCPSCVGDYIPINVYPLRYTIPKTDAGLLSPIATSAAALINQEQMLDFLAMVFDEDSEATGQAEQDQSFETLAMVLDESLEATGEEPVEEDDFVTEPEAVPPTEMSSDPAARWPYIAEVARLVLAMTFDVNPEQLTLALQDGLTPCQICEAQGMDISEVLTAEWPTREGIIQEAVASEFISPDEADWLRWMLATLPELCQEEGQFE